MTGKSTRLLSLEEEYEGDRQGTVDFVFCRIGQPVPLKPTHSDSAFDLSNPPSQPLAVSERHRVIFLAHSDGFLVANTKNVIGLAKDSMEKGKDLCIQKSSVVDVQIGGVSILALSGDNSMLAATVGGEIHLFSVQSLLDKVQEPTISCPLNKSGIVKDLKWRRSLENSFIVLSSHGSLCHGSFGLQLKDVMENVDAVDWSVDGNFVAIARKDTVIVLSSNFEEKLCFPLLFQSWTVDSGSEIKVDSIKWVRHDSIVIGCTQLNEDGDEDGYLVQVIASGEHKFTEASCKPVVFSFPDLFEELSVDMLPAGVGPYLLSNYLDCWDVMIASNKKNIDQHISLLRWLVEGNRYEVVSLELGSDKYIPRIDLQDDGDDNLILGLAVDKISLYEKIKIQRDMEFKELSPRCILLCLTCDGKLTLYHAAWVSEPSDLPKMACPHGDNIVNEGLWTVSSAESELRLTTSRLKDALDAAISDNIHISPGKPDIGAGGKMGSNVALDGAEPYSHPVPGMITSSYSRSAIEEPSMPSSAGGLGTNSTICEMASDSSTVKGSVTSKTLGSTMESDSSTVKGTVTSKTLGSTMTVGSTFGSQTAQKPFGVDGSNASASSTIKGIGASESLCLTINEVISTRSQTVKPFAMDATSTKHLLSSPGESNSVGIGNKMLFSPPSNCPAYLPSFSKPFGTSPSSEKINQSNINASSTKSGYTWSTSILPSSSVAASTKMPGSRQQLGNITSSKPRQRFESETQFSKQFYNMKDMVKELDALLFSIEYEGGFKDLCTVFQEQPLLALEAGLDNLSEVLFVYRNKIENQLMEIHQLRNKMLEVIARQVYMEGIVQQASDHRYWGIWNSQKLSPEFEVKRLHISNLKQNLTNQLIELERHFNRLEINKYDEYDTTPGWRASCRSSAPSRQTQSLHSVYSTVNSQLAAAEQLSECLLKQMAVLNISSPTSEKRNVTKELFESIGLDTKTDAFMSPDLKSSKLVPYSSKRTSLSSATALKKQSWKCAPNAVKAFEPESVRRKKDSLDKSWAHFEPSRTTIKRTSKKEQVRSNLDTPFREAKEVFDSQVKAFDIAQKAGMGSFSRPSVSQAQAFGITKRTSNGIASSQSKITFSNSQSFEQSPTKGVQEKPSNQAIDAQSKSIFKLPKDPSDLRSEPNTSSSPHSSQMFQNAATQPSSFAAPSIYTNSDSNKVEKFGSPLNYSSSSATKTALLSNSTSVSAAETRSKLVSSAQASTKNSTTPSNILLSSIAQTAASSSSPASSLSSFQFEKSMLQNSSLSSSNPKTPSSFSNELNSKLNKIGSELESAAVDGPAKELSSELKTDTSQASSSEILPPKKEVDLHLSAGVIMTTEKDEDANLSQEDEMEEEAIDTNSVLNMEALGGFSVQSTPSSNTLKPNPFGSSFSPASAGSASPLLSWNVSPGQLFRPPSFNLPESQPPQQSQSTGSSSLTGPSSGFSGFGQPAQLGSGQQALGSVLGSFGQSRQLGAGAPGFAFGSSGITASGNSGGFANAGGFAGAGAGSGAGGGFAGAASFSGGFAAAAGGGGGGGFGRAGSGSGITAGGFGGFGGIQGGGFSAFAAGNSSAGRPPAELLTQMRK